MARRSYDAKLARVLDLFPNYGRRALMRAYIACFTPKELCRAVSESWDWPTDLHLAFVKRLTRLGFQDRNGDGCRFLVSLMTGQAPSPKARRRIDAFLSRAFEQLPLDLRRQIAERWMGQGTAEGVSRWLRAIRSDEAVSGVEELRAYWRVSGDDRVARLLIARLSPSDLAALLEDIVARCEHGWTASRAMMTVTRPSEASWQILSERFPASYAYLCAKLGRKMSKAEALQIVARCEEYWPGDEQSLAIWAIGEQGMWDALDQIGPMLDAQESRRAKAFAKDTRRTRT